MKKRIIYILTLLISLLIFNVIFIRESSFVVAQPDTGENDPIIIGNCVFCGLPIEYCVCGIDVVECYCNEHSCFYDCAVGCYDCFLDFGSDDGSGDNDNIDYNIDMCHCYICDTDYRCEDGHSCSVDGGGGPSNGDYNDDEPICTCCGSAPCTCNKCPQCQKIIPSSLKSTSTDPECATCDCEDDTYILFNCENENPLLGEYYSIDMLVCGLHTKVVKYELFAESSSGISSTSRDYLVTESKNFHYEIQAIHGAIITYTCKIDYIWLGEEKSISYSYSIEEKFPDAIEIEIEFDMDMYSQWINGLNVCLASGMQKEFGMVFFYDSEGVYSKILGEGAATNCSDLKADIQIDYVESATRAFNADYGKYAIGCFHTHPPLCQCQNNTVLYSRPVGPSGIDESNNENLACFVYDYIDPIDSNHGLNDPSYNYQYNAFCRPFRQE